jgi:hypothetical protein
MAWLHFPYLYAQIQLWLLYDRDSSGTNFGSIFAYTNVIKSSALLFHNVFLTFIGVAIRRFYDMNFSGTYFTPFSFEIFNAILCSHVYFLVLQVFTLPGRGQRPLSTGLAPVKGDIYADEILR